MRLRNMGEVSVYSKEEMDAAIEALQDDATATYLNKSLNGSDFPDKYVTRANLQTAFLPPLVGVSGWWTQLSGRPWQLGPVPNTTFTKGTWRYAPFILNGDVPISGFDLHCSTVATGGTATAILARFSATTDWRVGPLVEDLSMLGSIDLAAGLGTRQMTFASRVFAKGAGFIGVGLSGTCTGNPLIAGLQGWWPGGSVQTLSAVAAANIVGGALQTIDGAVVPAVPDPSGYTSAGPVVRMRIA